MHLTRLFTISQPHFLLSIYKFELATYVGVVVIFLHHLYFVLVESRTLNLFTSAKLQVQLGLSTIGFVAHYTEVHVTL